MNALREQMQTAPWANVLAIEAFRSEVLCNLGLPAVSVLEQLFLVIEKLLYKSS